MPSTKTIDPLHKFREGVRATAKGVEKPVPLTSTAIAVRIDGGMAVVTTERTFRCIGFVGRRFYSGGAPAAVYRLAPVRAPG